MMNSTNILLPELLDPQRLPIAAIALIIVVCAGFLTGPLGGDVNPLIWRVYNGILSPLGFKMDKSDRTRGDLILRGFFLTIIALIIAYLLGKVFSVVVERIPVWRVPEIVLLCLFITGGTVWQTLLKLQKVLKNGKVGEGTYFAIAHSSRANLTQVDDFTITRKGIALAVRIFDKGLVAPLFWYLVAGFPALTVYAALCVLCWRFGRLGETGGLAVIPLFFEKVMGIVPNLLSAFVLTLSAVITPTAMMSRALKGWNAHKNSASYSFGGLPLNIVAWALDISIGGPVTDLDGNKIKGGWVGPEKASAQLTSGHLKRAVYLVMVAATLYLAIILGLMIIYGNQLLDF